MVEDPNLRACPYIGLSSDASISRLVATSAHRCHRWATPQTVEKDHQVAFCLNDNHIKCPWFVQPGGSFSSRREQYNPISRKQRIVGVAALLSVLLMVFITGKMFVWPVLFGGNQEIAAGGIPVATATSAPAGAAMTQTAVQTVPITTVTVTQSTTTASPQPTDVQSTAVPVAAQPTVTSTPTATRAISTAVTLRPTSTPSPTARPQITPPAGGLIYEVQSGDTLYGLATAHGITVEDIMKANGLTDRASLRVGQKLVIPPAR